jgi:hypothetical protein
MLKITGVVISSEPPLTEMIVFGSHEETRTLDTISFSHPLTLFCTSLESLWTLVGFVARKGIVSGKEGREADGLEGKIKVSCVGICFLLFSMGVLLDLFGTSRLYVFFFFPFLF